MPARKKPGTGKKTARKPGSRRRKTPSTPPRGPRTTAATPETPGVVTIRKYANRRLYDTAASRHITQEDLYRMVGRGTIVRILDATTEEDITNQTLALALIEHDPAKLRLMPSWLLHQMIRLHEQALGGWLSPLWQPLAASGSAPLPGRPPAAGLGLGAWNPWAANANPEPAPAPQTSPSRDESLDELRREVSRLLRRLGELEGSG